MMQLLSEIIRLQDWTYFKKAFKRIYKTERINTKMRERLEIQKGNTNSWLLYFSILSESQRSEQTGVAFGVAHMHNFVWTIDGFLLKPFIGIN